MIIPSFVVFSLCLSETFTGSVASKFVKCVHITRVWHLQPKIRHKNTHSIYLNLLYCHKLTLTYTSLLYRGATNAEDVEMFMFVTMVLCCLVPPPPSSFSSRPLWMGKSNIIKVPCQWSALCWVITPNLQRLSLGLNIQMFGGCPPSAGCTRSINKSKVAAKSHLVRKGGGRL